MEHSHAGHRQRLRDRFVQGGASAFADHELLELLLTYAIPRRDVNATAHALLDRFGSLEGVLCASVAALCKVEGVGEGAFCTYSMACSSASRSGGSAERTAASG